MNLAQRRIKSLSYINQLWIEVIHKKKINRQKEITKRCLEQLPTRNKTTTDIKNIASKLRIEIVASAASIKSKKRNHYN